MHSCVSSLQEGRGVSGDGNCGTHGDGQAVPGAKTEYCGKKQLVRSRFPVSVRSKRSWGLLLSFEYFFRNLSWVSSVCPCLFVFSGEG